MGSRLREIYDALANLPIAIDGKNVRCRPLAENTGVVTETPLRILSPLSDRNEGRGISNLTFGHGASLEWIISELVLIASVQDGSGLEYHTPFIVEYQQNFVSAYATMNRNLGLAPKSITVNGADIEIGVYNYPLGADNWYYGLKISWTIRENL